MDEIYREPTIRSRELGEGLRDAMKKADLTGKVMAVKLGWSETKISRLLKGARGAKEVDVASFLGLCGVIGEERARLLELCKDQHSQGWFQQYGARLPKQLRTLIDHENQAISIAAFEPTLIPGLLQTADYAQAVISANVGVPPDEVEERVIAKLARQRLLQRDRAPQCTFYVHEFALHLPVGGTVVMSDQLHHLLRMSVRSAVTLRVVPATIGAHSATAGAFRLMGFASFKPVVYVECETASLFLERPDQIAVYQGILADLADIALDEGESRELIASVATGLPVDQGVDDEHA